MQIYSKKIVKFMHDLQKTIEIILSKEIGVSVFRGRFFNRKKTHSYPISVVIYNDRKMLGYFDPVFYELGFHECLMHVASEVLHNVIRHELTHYMLFIEDGYPDQPHGAEFKAFCRKMDWSDEVSRASLCLEELAPDRPVLDTDVVRKIQKLMALSSSGNKYEAESAMLKSQQLLLKYNMESRSWQDEEKIFLKRLMKQKQKTAKMQAIAKILESFFVHVVYRRTNDGVCLEVVGKEVNLQIAEYVSDVLFDKLDDLWKETGKEHKLKGIVAKNSFFLGVAKGYCDKIAALKRAYQSEVLNALVILEKELMHARELVYKKLTFIKKKTSYCAESSILGEQAGKQLQINPALASSPTKTFCHWITDARS